MSALWSCVACWWQVTHMIGWWILELGCLSWKTRWCSSGWTPRMVSIWPRKNRSNLDGVIVWSCPNDLVTPRWCSCFMFLHSFLKSINQAFTNICQYVAVRVQNHQSLMLNSFANPKRFPCFMMVHLESRPGFPRNLFGNGPAWLQHQRWGEFTNQMIKWVKKQMKTGKQSKDIGKYSKKKSVRWLQLRMKNSKEPISSMVPMPCRRHSSLMFDNTLAIFASPLGWSFELTPRPEQNRTETWNLPGVGLQSYVHMFFTSGNPRWAVSLIQASSTCAGLEAGPEKMGYKKGRYDQQFCIF